MNASRPILFDNCRLAFPDFLAEGALLADEGHIQAIWIHEKPSSVPANAQRIDGRSLILAPGLIDIHNHGGVTHDFVTGDPEGNNIALKYHADNGVTAMLATIMTETPEQMASCLKALGDQHRRSRVRHRSVAHQRDGRASRERF